MTDDALADTPDLSRPYCPTCEPDADPLREILRVRWCWDHPQVVTGADDAAVGPFTVVGSTEFSAEANRRICALLAGRET